LTSTLFTHSRQLGRTEVPRGAEADRVVLENLVAQFTKRSPLTAVYAMTYLVGELLVGHRPSPSKAAVSGLWRASESEDLDVAGAALTTILFFSDSNSTWRTRIKSILRQHTSREALRRKIAAHLVGIDQAFSAISRPIRERVARRMVHDGLMIDPQKYEMLPALGASFLAQGDAARAQTFFERAAELPLFTKPRHPVGLLGGRQDFLNLVAATQGSRGQLDQAVKTLKTVLSIYPYDGQARARLCQVLEQRSQWREFAHCLREWSEYHPHFLPIYVRRAALLVRLGRQSEAL
jgi:tetratricopeptide (TPR) repeat protein